MAAKPFILAVNGSPHKDGTVQELVELVLAGAREAGAETRTIHLYDLKMEHAPGNYSRDPNTEIIQHMPKDDLTALYPEIIRADGLVLGTPVYWSNMSGAMKDFIDRLTPLENEDFKLYGKIAAFVAASKENEGGATMAVMSMVTALAQMGVMIPPEAIMWHPGSWTTTEGAASWAKEDAPMVGRNMVRLSRLLSEQKFTWQRAS